MSIEPTDPWIALQRIARIAREAMWSYEIPRVTMERIARLAIAPLHDRQNFSYPEDAWLND